MTAISLLRLYFQTCGFAAQKCSIVVLPQNKNRTKHLLTNILTAIRSSSPTASTSAPVYNAPVQKVHVDVDTIISHQNANGSFSEKVVELLCVNVDDLQRISPLPKEKFSIFVACVVVAFLEFKMKKEENSWELSVRKTKKFLRKEAGDEVTFQIWVTAAEKFVKNLQ